MRTLALSARDFELSMCGPKGKERIKILDGYPDTLLSRTLFYQLGTMHLVAPYLPSKIATNFMTTPWFKEIIDAMYKSEDRTLPILPSLCANLKFYGRQTRTDRAIVAYSAGKDSISNMWRAQEKYGAENVMAAHISGLNRHNAPRELEFSKRQAKKFGFKNFRIVRLLNSSKNTGYKIMRSRDIFLAGLLIPIALEFGAKWIITEGFAETTPRELFSGQKRNMIFFNKLIAEIGIPVEVTWRDRKEMDVLKDLYQHKPEWMPHVCNCFSAPHYHANLHKSWYKKVRRLLCMIRNADPAQNAELLIWREFFMTQKSKL